MQKKATQKKPVEIVRRPIIEGSWHGRDARKTALKRAVGFLGVSLIYLLTCALLSFENFWLRVLMSAMVIAIAAYYQFAVGLTKGQSDAAYGEILYNRRESGHEIPDSEKDRSFHALKGYFAVLAGCLPFVMFAVVFACLTEKTAYTLGVLPSWTESMMYQTEFGAALSYYHAQPGLGAVSVMRIIDRAMVMPFVNVASAIGADALLVVERLSPILLLISPIWYGVGYAQGLNYRARINTGIKMGDDKKKRRERKARRQRQRSTAPERLI